jgi:hypothetical protein
VPAAACTFPDSPGVNDSAQSSAPTSAYRALITHTPRVLQALVTPQPILRCHQSQQRCSFRPTPQPPQCSSGGSCRTAAGSDGSCCWGGTTGATTACCAGVPHQSCPATATKVRVQNAHRRRDRVQHIPTTVHHAAIRQPHQPLKPQLPQGSSVRRHCSTPSTICIRRSAPTQSHLSCLQMGAANSPHTGSEPRHTAVHLTLRGPLQQGHPTDRH